MMPFFKWRRWPLLLFLPVLVIALREAGISQRAEGDLIDDIREAFCVTVSFAGLLIRATGRNSAAAHLGNLIIFLGGVLFIPVLWFELLAVPALCLYYISAMRRKEAFQLSFKEVLRREYPVLFAIIAGFTFLDLAEDFVANGRFEFDWGWAAFFAAGLTIYAVLKWTHKEGYGRQ